jgi:N utilization substance protein B
MQMLFLVDQNPDAERQRIRRSIESELTDPALAGFAWQLFSGVCDCREELDAKIRETATNWRLERMATTDRNVLRLGLYEMLHVGTPAPVVLNEAIELAKEFGTEHSASFVNGILDKLIPDRAQKTKADVGQSADTLTPN